MTPKATPPHEQDPSTLQILLAERELVHGRILRVEAMMLSFVGLIVTPFCILVGYALLNFDGRARYALLVVPFFSVLGIMVMGVLYMHHFVVGIYCRYLVQRINRHIQDAQLLLERLDYAFFAAGFSLHRTLIVVCLGFVAALNIWLAALITEVLLEFPLLHAVTVHQIWRVALVYWGSFSFLYVLGLGACLRQFGNRVRRLHAIVRAPGVVMVT